MRDYELTVLFHPDLEMNLDPALDKVKKIIASNKGEITKEEMDGKKRIAYSIKGQEFAIYYFADVQLPADAPAKIESVLNITDEVLRHMLVKTDPRKAKLAARRKAREDTEEETSEAAIDRADEADEAVEATETVGESETNQKKGE